MGIRGSHAAERRNLCPPSRKSLTESCVFSSEFFVFFKPTADTLLSRVPRALGAFPNRLAFTAFQERIKKVEGLSKTSFMFAWFPGSRAAQRWQLTKFELERKVSNVLEREKESSFSQPVRNNAGSRASTSRTKRIQCY
ncbi:hypothetical protein CEXT_661611 [Caerostris extrusa]|uniref:Uncharacterized protein n=1 Tax=Caerostris extrusa TaxID=172846 RepID=A0AAV4WA64_CAEEX|nr:hypothetical protein CEXT_661611 [Caerostris extrusa]